jgi:hypothetical protein
VEAIKGAWNVAPASPYPTTAARSLFIAAAYWEGVGFRDEGKRVLSRNLVGSGTTMRAADRGGEADVA